MCMSQYALLYEPPGQHTRTARGGPARSAEGTWTVADNALLSSANGRAAETSTASSTGWAIVLLTAVLPPVGPRTADGTAGAGLVETGAGRREQWLLAPELLPLLLVVGDERELAAGGDQVVL